MRTRCGLTKCGAAIAMLVTGFGLMTACNSVEETPTAPTKELHGLWVEGTTADQAILFFGVQQDLVSELASVRAGNQLEEPWYLVELPIAALPDAEEVKTFDLAKEDGITLRFRLQLPDQNPTGLWFWATVEAASGPGGGLAGSLELSGTHVVSDSKGVSSDGTQRGFALDARHTGDVTVNDMTYHIQNGQITLGSLFGSVVSGEGAGQ